MFWKFQGGIPMKKKIFVIKHRYVAVTVISSSLEEGGEFLFSNIFIR